MGIYKPLIKGARSLEEFEQIDHSNDKTVTPGDVMTYSRPPLASIAAWMLLTGRRPASIVAGIAMATDMEGQVCRWIDKTWPNSGYGSTEHGARRDPIADTMAMGILGGAILGSPKVSASGKIATATVFGVEGYKTQWALRSNAKFKNFTGEPLILPASADGKEAMAEKMTAIEFAIATNDVDNQVLKAALGAGAMAFAGVGSYRGERARRAYEPLIEDLIAHHLENIPQAA